MVNNLTVHLYHHALNRDDGSYLPQESLQFVRKKTSSLDYKLEATLRITSDEDTRLS